MESTTSTRNNFDTPPVNPRRAWSDEQGQSDHSWIRSSEDDPSFEIMNEFGVSSTSTSTRPNTSPQSIELTEQSISSQASSPSGPVPTPRKRTQSFVATKPTQTLETQNRQLTCQVNELKREKQSMEIELTQLKENTKKVAAKNVKLQLEMGESVRRVHELEAELRRPPLVQDGGEVEGLRREVDSLRSDKRELEKKLKAKEMELLSASMSTVSTGGTKSNQRTAYKLNEAVGKLKAKEEEVQYLKEQLSRHTTGKSGVSMELNRTKENLHRVTQERSKLEFRVETLNTELSSVNVQLSQIQNNYTSKCDELTQLKRDKEAECADLQKQLTALQAEYDDYTQSYTMTHEETSRTTDQLTTVNTTLRDQLASMTSERDILKQKCNALEEEQKKTFDQINDLQKMIRQLKGEHQRETASMGKIFEELQKEAGDTLGNYNTVAEQLVRAEKERDDYRMKSEQSLQVLATRNNDLRAAEAALQECERSWRAKLEKSKKKEQEEAEQAKQVIETQMSVYREDFNEERKARESMAGEKHKLEHMLKTKNEEIKALKKQLNQQSAMAMQTDWEAVQYPDSPDSPPPVRAQDPGYYQLGPAGPGSGYQQPGPAGPGNGYQQPPGPRY